MSGWQGSKIRFRVAGMSKDDLANALHSAGHGDCSVETEHDPQNNRLGNSQECTASLSQDAVLHLLKNHGLALAGCNKRYA